MPDRVRVAKKTRRRDRLRAVLVAAIVVLLLGIVVLTVLGLRLLQPAGTPKTPGQVSESLQWVRSLYGFGGAADEQLLEPTSVAIAPNGDIYANDPQRARIMRFGADGVFKALVHTGAGGAGKGQFVRPAGLAVDERGELYVADPVANKIIVFDDGGRYLREWPSERPLGVTVADDAVFVLTNGKVSVYSLTGVGRGSFGSRGREAEMIDAYQGIVVEGSRIYIADALNACLKGFDKGGRLVWASPSAAATGSALSRPATEAAYILPQDLVMDGAGRLVAIDAFAFQVVVADPKSGKVLGRYGDQGTEDGLFVYPTGIDYDSERDWFAIADTRNNRVQIVRIPGSGDSPAATGKRLSSGPWRYCAAPILLALLALIVAVATRRRDRESDREQRRGHDLSEDRTAVPVKNIEEDADSS